MQERGGRLDGPDRVQRLGFRFVVYPSGKEALTVDARCERVDCLLASR